jgi:hypothetical protein
MSEEVYIKFMANQPPDVGMTEPITFDGGWMCWHGVSGTFPKKSPNSDEDYVYSYMDQDDLDAFYAAEVLATTVS